MKALVLYYSLHGHVFKIAQAIAEGAKSVPDAEVILKRVPETLPPEIIEKMGATAAQQAQATIPVATVADLENVDAVFFGTPTRYGNMTAQMAQFIDTTGQIWQQGKLVGKVGSVFTSSANQHGGQESTILSFHHTLFHHGMIVAGLPYAFQGQMRMDEITGSSPYGTSTISGPDGSRMPSENELQAARFQGKFVTEIAAKLASN